MPGTWPGAWASATRESTWPPRRTFPLPPTRREPAATTGGKGPRAALGPGQTEEGELGLTYEELDDILYGLVEGRRSRREMVEAGHRPAIVARILRMIKNPETGRTA